MRVCMIYSGWLRTWEGCEPNHRATFSPAPDLTIDYNETHANLMHYKVDKWGYKANKAPECIPENTMNMWHNMYQAWSQAPKGFDVYVRNRYDITFSGPIDFGAYQYDGDTVYIPTGNDYRDGINDQFAFGNYEAMKKYYSVYLYHSHHFAQGKPFHSESYLKHTLELLNVNIVRIPVTNQIKHIHQI